MKKMFLKSISVFLTAIILLGGLLQLSYAEAKPGVYLISDKKDDKLILSVYYENADKMQGTWFTLGYDNNLIKPSEVTHKNGTDSDIWSDALSGEKYIEAYNFIDNTVLYTGAFLEDISAVAKDASEVHYVDIVFDINKDKSAEVNGSVITLEGVICISGVYHEIKLEYAINPLSDPDLSPRRYSGDVDNDGKVTAADARRILRYSVALEDISKDDIAYADLDFNSLISAADARLALRSSVALEELHGHYFIYDDGKYVCGYCKKTFEVKLMHIHKYNYQDCYSMGVCECGSKNTTVRGHIYSTSSPKCSVCGIDVISIINKAENTLEYAEKISIYYKNAVSAYEKGDLYTVIEAALYINVYYEDIINTLKNCNELKKSREEFIKAQDITEAAVDSIVASSGDISVSRANADKVYAAMNKAAAYEKTALQYLDDAAGMYIK